MNYTNSYKNNKIYECDCDETNEKLSFTKCDCLNKTENFKNKVNLQAESYLISTDDKIKESFLFDKINCKFFLIYKF